MSVTRENDKMAVFLTITDSFGAVFANILLACLLQIAGYEISSNQNSGFYK